MFSSRKAQDIQQKIQKLAETIGYKAANLCELDEICPEINHKLNFPGFTVKVPDNLPLTDVSLVSHLSEYAPEWKDLWASFKAKQKELKETQHLSKEALEILKKLQLLILKTFAEHPIRDSMVEAYLDRLKREDPHVILMVRSTGKAEDRVDIMNPGGNESTRSAANANAISQAIAIVLNSYTSEKSFKQRLLTQGKTKQAKEIDAILEEPFMAVLLQRMVGEPLLESQTLPDSKKVPISGVMYTSTAGTRLQYAPGHGTLIVNSEGLFDSSFVTRENIVHAEINRKPWRLVSSLKREENQEKMKLVRVKNPKELQDKPSISNLVALKIAEVGHFIEDHYGMPMNVEFVYEPNPEDAEKGTFWLVQARPLSEGDVKLVVPSSMAPEKLPALKKLQTEKKIAIEKATVITAAGSAAHVIVNPNQILIFDNIKQALDIYLSQEDSPVKAVIVKEIAAATSHEAGLFESKAIPVLQVSDITTIEAWRHQEPLVIVIDPQRRQCINFSSLVKNPLEAEKELYDSGILKVGIFKSPLPAQETLIPLFPYVTEAVKDKLRLSKMLSIDTTQKIGDLIEKANSKNEKESEIALNELMSSLFLQLPKSYPLLQVTTFYKTMLENLEILESVQPGKENQDSTSALQTILTNFYCLGNSSEGKKEGSPHRQLFRQAMITGFEIYRSLGRLSQLISTISKEEAESAQQEFLDLTSKLEALITNPGNKELFSDSIFQIARQNKSLKIAEKVEGFRSLPEEQQVIFVELMKLQKIALNTKTAKQWERFAFTCCQDKELTKKLSFLVRIVVTNGIAADWINESFPYHSLHKKPVSMANVVLFSFGQQSDSKKTVELMQVKEILNALLAEISKVGKTLSILNLEEKSQLLETWERRIPEWSEPATANFDKLWKKYCEEIIPLIDELHSIDIKELTIRKIVCNKIMDLRELMDKTIKAITGSFAYAKNEPKLQVERFAILLEPYYRLMERSIDAIPKDKWKAFDQCWIVSGQKFYGDNRKHKLAEIKEIFDYLKNNLTPGQLKATANVSVPTLGIDSPTPYGLRDEKANITLETLFSLMHHNGKIATLAMRDWIPFVKNLPEPLQPIYEVLIEDPIVRLMKSEYQFPILVLDFNVALSIHSLKCTFEYNQLDSQCQIEISIFSEPCMSQGGSRFRGISVVAELDAILMAAEFKLKRSDHILSFTLKMNAKQLLDQHKALERALRNYFNMVSMPSSQVPSFMSYCAEKFFGFHTSLFSGYGGLGRDYCQGKSFSSHPITLNEVSQFIKNLSRLKQESKGTDFLSNASFVVKLVKYFSIFSKENGEIAKFIEALVAGNALLPIEMIRPSHFPTYLEPGAWCVRDYELAKNIILQYEDNIDKNKVLGRMVTIVPNNPWSYEDEQFLTSLLESNAIPSSGPADTDVWVVIDKLKQGEPKLKMIPEWREGDNDFLDVLLQSGADPNYQNEKTGNTPMHQIILDMKGSFGGVDMSHAITSLLAHGAKWDIPNSKGETPISLLEDIIKKNEEPWRENEFSILLSLIEKAKKNKAVKK